MPHPAFNANSLAPFAVCGYLPSAMVYCNPLLPAILLALFFQARARMHHQRWCLAVPLHVNSYTASFTNVWGGGKQGAKALWKSHLCLCLLLVPHSVRPP